MRLTLFVWLFISSFLFAVEMEEFLAVIKPKDASVDFPPAAGAIIVGKDSQLLYLKAENAAVVMQTLSAIPNVKVTAFYASFNKGELSFPNFPKDVTLTFFDVKQRPAEMDLTKLPKTLWSCDRNDSGLFVVVGEVELDGAKVLVSGTRPK